MTFFVTQCVAGRFEIGPELNNLLISHSSSENSCFHMQSLILAGGKGTRLRPLTVYTPKPIVPVMNRAFVLYQLEILARAGITDITLSLSYQPDKIEDVLGDGSDFGVKIRFVTEPSPMGTAGAFKFAADPKGGTTIVLNGDILTDVDISDVIACHRSRKADATLVLARVDDPSRYGLVETDPDGNILKFLEKPKPGDLSDSTVNTINAGIYILEPSVLDLIPEGENYSFEYNVFPALLEKGLVFNSCILEKEYWRDIGNPASYLQAHLDFLDGKIKGFDRPEPAHSEIATAANVDERSVLGEGCVIKPNAKIVNSVLGPGVHVEEKALIENSVIWSHSRISSFVEMNGAVLGRGCYVGRNAVVRAGTVLGDKASIPDYSQI